MKLSAPVPFLILSLILACTALPAEDHIVHTATGRAVPLSAIRARFYVTTPADATKRLYHLDGNTLHGAHARARLYRPASRGTTHRPLSLRSTRLVVNGRDVAYDPAHDGFLTSVGSFHTAHTPTGAVIAIWGPGLNLVPVHTTEHPGIFINMAREDEKKSGAVPPANGQGPANVTESSGFVEDNDAIPASLGPLGGDHPPDRTPPLLTRQSSTCRHGSGCRVLRIAVASDYKLCALQGGDRSATLALILARIALASLPYERQTCLRLVVSYIELNCDPATDLYRDMHTFKFKTVLPSLRAYWLLERTSVQRDVMLYLPGHFTPQSVSGIAYIKSVCDEDSAYAWAEGIEPVVISHELAHVIACSHTRSGLMQPDWSSASYPSRFSSVSLRQLHNSLDSNASSDCMPTCAEYGLVPKPSPLVIPTPSSSPKAAVSMFCSSGFSRTGTFSCTRYNVGSVGFATRSVTVNAVQGSDFIKVILEGTTSNVRIRRLSLVLSTVDTLDVADYPADRRLNTRKTSVKIPLDTIAKKTTLSRCCNETIYYFMRVRLCEGTACSEGIVAPIGVPMKCTSCSRTRYIPAGTGRRCPLCRR